MDTHPNRNYSAFFIVSPYRFISPLVLSSIRADIESQNTSTAQPSTDLKPSSHAPGTLGQPCRTIKFVPPKNLQIRSTETDQLGMVSRALGRDGDRIWP